MYKFNSDAIDAGTRLRLEEEFFSNRFTLSYSGLNRLLYSPQLFYNDYVLKGKQESIDKYLVEGKLIHCLLLTPSEFDKQFAITPKDLPSDSAKALLHALFNHHTELSQTEEYDGRTQLEEYGNAILDILVDMNLHQSLKTDTQRLEKIIIDKNIEYWNYLLNADGRSIIDDNQLEFAKQVVETIKAKSKINKLMGLSVDPFDKVQVLNEFYVHLPAEHLPFDLKGFIDNLVIDHNAKVIRINDLKKSSKDIQNFKDSIDYYRYDLQAAMYYNLITNTLAKEYGYDVEFRFIVVDSLMQVAPYKVSYKTMFEWVNNLNTKLEEASYHFNNRDFDLPYIFAVNHEVEL